MYAPICMVNYAKPLPACRSLCLRVRRGCEPLMIQYGFAWPQRMNCDELPEFGDHDQLCMDFNANAEPADDHRPTSTSSPAPVQPPHRTASNCSCR